MTMLAQHHGRCTDCDEDIAPGQRIVRDDLYERWVHANCNARPETTPCACERCFLVHRGECFA